MRWLIAITLTLTLAAGTVRAATTGDVMCASYRAAIAKETDHAKRESLIRSMPATCGAPPVHRVVEPVKHPVAPPSAPVPTPTTATEEAAPAFPAVTMPPAASVSAEQANQNGNRAYQTRDYVQAMQWFRISADKGNAMAQNDIGGLYFFGHGVKADYAEAMRWYRLSAAQGNAAAQDGIGALYARGQGVAVDYAQAMKWFRLAAAQNNADAENWIGYLYAHGLGVPTDAAQAQSWYAKAAAQGARPGQP